MNLAISALMLAALIGVPLFLVWSDRHKPPVDR